MSELQFPEIYREGVQAGESAWNPDPSKIQIKNPYPGSTQEGIEFYLGFNRGLHKASIAPMP